MDTFKRSAALALAAVVSIAGCSGKDGATGATGPTGPTGPAGPVTTTSESCMVCHASTRLVPTASSHATNFAGGYQDTLAISNVVVSNDGADHVRVAFHVANSVGAVTNVGNTDLRFYLNGLVPAAAASNGKASDYFQQWVQERSATGFTFGTLDTSGAASGDYVYTSNAVYTDAPADSTLQRIFFRVSKTGNFTGNYAYDFDKADPTFASVANPRDIVPSATCNKCHLERIADHGHGGGYNITNACITCHSPLYPNFDMQTNGFDFPTMIHQIHAAYDHTKGGTAPGVDWSEITYPSQLNDCAVCHTGGAASDNYKNNPNAIGCTSCHTFVKFTDSPGYDAGTVACGDPSWTFPNDCNHSPARATTANCAGCHDPAAIDGYHDATYNRVHPAAGQTMNNVPEYDVNLAIAPPAAGTFYVPGTDTLSITVTLKNKSDGSDVPSSFYTDPKHATGTTSTTALSNARLYVYGPRTSPKPVLTTGSANTPPAQGPQLFLPSTDPNVKTDATGFKYQVAIPAGFPSGTYFVRFYATNYGYVSDTNYMTDSNAFQVIQIGTATAQDKVAGDACTNCHGTHTAAFHDARHNVVFDTDQCISCHDLSGNFADPLSNRVHAIHSSSASGDTHNRDWTEVEYPVGYRSGSGIRDAVPPGATMRCSVCHTSGNAQFQQNVAEISCMGCHADAPGALDHFRQNGGEY